MNQTIKRISVKEQMRRDFEARMYQENQALRELVLEGNSHIQDLVAVMFKKGLTNCAEWNDARAYLAEVEL